MADDFAVGDSILWNKTEFAVLAIFERCGEPWLTIGGKSAGYQTQIRVRDAVLMRRAGEPAPDTHPYTYVTAMNNWRVGDVVLYQGEEHRIVGMYVDGNASLHIVVANQYRQSEVLGELTLLRRAGDEGDDGGNHDE